MVNIHPNLSRAIYINLDKPTTIKLISAKVFHVLCGAVPYKRMVVRSSGICRYETTTRTMPPKKKVEEEEVKGASRFGRTKNNLKFGVVGLPNVENFPFCTIDPNESRCAVPDERYNYLCKQFSPPSE
eukprot:Awhi_evm1s3537